MDLDAALGRRIHKQPADLFGQIVHIRGAFDPEGSDWMSKDKILGATMAVRDTAGAGPLPFAQEQPGEVIFPKNSCDSFQNTDLLRYLVENAGKVVSRQDLYRAIFNYDYDGLDRSIDVYISRLRHKLGDDPSAPHYIKTVRGVGYLLVGEQS